MVSRILFVVALFFSSQSFAGWGINAGTGIPFLAQLGVNYEMSPSLGFYAAYQVLDVSVGTASVELALPEVGVMYYPWAGSFFIGAALGQETLKVDTTDVTTGLQARADVDALTAAAKLGWMWGRSDGGFWFGVDVAYIMPFNETVSITNPGIPTTDQDYRDLVDAAEQFGETAYVNFTFARIGYLF